MNIKLCLLGEKAYAFLKGFLLSDVMINHKVSIEVGRDRNLTSDYSSEILALAQRHRINCLERSQVYDNSKFEKIIAVGWRWMINEVDDRQLIIIHDSLLPKYRGFAPLVNALMNKEPLIGVTALYGNREYDTGDIIMQRQLLVEYPIRISEAIRKISCLYEEIANELGKNISSNLVGKRQSDSDATYSPWLDEKDYLIDWRKDSSEIANKINLLGAPYKHALTYMNGVLVAVLGASIVTDMRIARPDVGKVIKVGEGKPYVICGNGVVVLENILDAEGNSLVPLKQFRTRFSNDPV